jgi:prepilin-type N-terminal cleavage/methylation domain-containing protein
MNRGYSLVECLLVIVCGAILLTFAIPNIQHFIQVWALWGGVKSVESSLYWGRMHAISSNASMMFEIAGDGHEFWWTDPASGSPYASSGRRLDGIRIVSAPKRPLRFYQHGNAVPAGTYTIQGEAGSFSVVVSPGGRIRVQKN